MSPNGTKAHLLIYSIELPDSVLSVNEDNVIDQPDFRNPFTTLEETRKALH
jgi:hypothetical protein